LSKTTFEFKNKITIYLTAGLVTIAKNRGTWLLPQMIRVMVFSTSFNNISFISWLSVLLILPQKT
jgi:hypothetical protein